MMNLIDLCTQDQLTDIFTKPLGKFERFVDKIKIKEIKAGHKNIKVHILLNIYAAIKSY